jgi:hypothetical protein
MGKQSKATQARLKNLSSARYRAHVEDLIDSEDSDSDYIPVADANSVRESMDGARELFNVFALDDDLSDSDMDCDSGTDPDDEEELRSEADLLTFATVMKEAQEVAEEAERQSAVVRPKRKHRYTGNSARTKRHHAQKRRELAAAGQHFISSFFWKREQAETSEDESEIESLDVERRLSRLFSEDERSVVGLKQYEKKDQFY